MLTAKALRIQLRSQGMTQQKASEITGVPQHTISRAEDEDINNMQMHNANIPDLRVLRRVFCAVGYKLSPFKNMFPQCEPKHSRLHSSRLG